MVNLELCRAMHWEYIQQWSFWGLIHKKTKQKKIRSEKLQLSSLSLLHPSYKVFMIPNWSCDEWNKMDELKEIAKVVTFFKAVKS